MHEGASCPPWLVGGPGCSGGLGAAASCGSSAGLWGFSPGFSSTFCRRSSFLEGITHTGLVLPQGIVLCPGSGYPMCPGAAVGSGGGSSLLDTLPCFPQAFPSLT